MDYRSDIMLGGQCRDPTSGTLALLGLSRLGAETMDVEVGQHGMRCALDDLVRQQFAGDQAEGGTAVGEGEREARHILDPAQYGVAVAGDGFLADAEPVGLQPWVPGQ